jgi:hypothetical protein
MQNYITEVVDDVAVEVVESKQFNEMVSQIIKNSDISISTDPL